MAELRAVEELFAVPTAGAGVGFGLKRFAKGFDDVAAGDAAGLAAGERLAADAAGAGEEPALLTPFRFRGVGEAAGDALLDGSLLGAGEVSAFLRVRFAFGEAAGDALGFAASAEGAGDASAFFVR